MSDRPTKTATLPQTKQKVEVKEYATGRELREISNAMLDGVNYHYEGTKVKSDSVPYSKADAQQDKTIEIMVVKLADDDKKILDRVLDLPKKDFNFIKNMINEATADSDSDEAEKKD